MRSETDDINSDNSSTCSSNNSKHVKVASYHGRNSKNKSSVEPPKSNYNDHVELSPIKSNSQESSDSISMSLPRCKTVVSQKFQLLSYMVYENGGSILRLLVV